jgi:hypothetical protein
MQFGAPGAWCDIPRHLSFFTEASLKQVLHSQGLKVHRAYYAQFVRQFSPEWLLAQKEFWRRMMPNSAVPNFDLRIWWLLARTTFAPQSAKYDSIRIHASRI